MAPRWLVVGLAALSSCACGSRSGLLSDTVGGAAGAGFGGASGGLGGTSSGGVGGVSDGGAGGAPAGGGTGGISGAAGTGGSVNDCPTLAPLEPVLEVEQPAGADDRAPVLTYTGADHQRVVVAFAPAPQLLPTLYLGVSTIFAWEPWPSAPSLSSARYNMGAALPGSTVSYEVWATESFDGTFAVGGVSQSVGPPLGFSCTNFDPSWTPQTFAFGQCQHIAGDFFAKGPPHLHLAGKLQDTWVHVQLFGDPLPPSKTGAMGCTPADIVASAVGYQNGWLVAHSNSPGLELTNCTFNPPVPATDIEIERVGADTTVTPLVNINASAPIVALETVPHPSGLYVVWRVMSGGKIAPIRFARVDVNTMQTVGPIDLTAPDDAPLDGFSATAAGSRLAVAWGNDDGNGAPDIVVSVADENGAVLGRGTLADRFDARVSAAGSPNGDSVVVGWDEAASSAKRQVKLARFDCVPGG